VTFALDDIDWDDEIRVFLEERTSFSPDGLDPADGAATLTEMTAAAIARGAEHFPQPARRWLITGGGRHNPALMDALRRRLAVPVEPVEAAGYFIACEALANVLKHAGASRATVMIAADNGTLMIRVTDDGGGFDPSTAVRSGLRGLQDRVDALGGRLEVTSSHSGTTLSASLPHG